MLTSLATSPWARSLPLPTTTAALPPAPLPPAPFPPWFLYWVHLSTTSWFGRRNIFFEQVFGDFLGNRCQDLSSIRFAKTLLGSWSKNDPAFNNFVRDYWLTGSSSLWQLFFAVLSILFNDSFFKVLKVKLIDKGILVVSVGLDVLDTLPTLQTPNRRHIANFQR